MKKMKKICTILLVCSTILSNAQTLEYNRTIDTLLAITIPGGTVFNITNRQIIGNYISAPSNKVWKVQSIIVMPVPAFDINGNTILQYQSSNNYGDFNSISARISLMLKNNSFENELFSDPIPGQGTANQGSNKISSPIWLNNSELGIAFTHAFNQAVSQNNPYLNPNWGSYTGYVHLSILEFNTN